ncbi:MAG: hypothetical protein ABID38_05110 [Candidatus Diapherotrites archaeon]
MKAQASMEYLIIIAFLLLAVGLLFVLSLIMFDDSSRFSAAQIAISKLKNAADEVDGLGEGNTRIVEIVLPKGVTAGRGLENVIEFTIGISGTTTSAKEFPNAKVTYVSLPISEGIHFIRVESIDGNVLLSEV